MKRIFFASLILVTVFALFIVPKAEAQSNAQIISVNEPISEELRNAVNYWLQNSPPSLAEYYAVTYTKSVGESTYVSLVGLNIENATDFWSIAGDEFGNQYVTWMDTIQVFDDGAITFPFQELAVSGKIKFADLANLPQAGAGGGSYVRFPWQPAKAVQYGILGVHDADYGTDGGSWGAVDLVSGSDMGSGAANDSVYASVSGTVNFICDYEDTVAVRISGNGDSFLYAHLLPNANLELDHTFSAGALIGKLKHGSFVDECGNAVQQDDHWHLHWGFVKSGGRFQAEGCLLSGGGPTASWKCGNTTIRVLGYLTHYGNIGINPDTGTIDGHSLEGAGGGPSFWDFFLEGAKAIFDFFITNNLPEHQSASAFITPIVNGVKIVFRIALVLLRGNFNFAPAVTLIVLTITIRVALSAVFGFVGIYRVLR